MIPVYICDDDPVVSARLNRIVSDQIMILNGDMGPVRTTDDPRQLLEWQHQDMVPAVYFLDIDFPEQISGLELAQQLRQYDPRGFIVFITGHGDLVFETFRLRLEAMDYIVKGDYQEMAVRVRDCLTSIQERLRNEPSGKGQYCTLKMFDTVRHIPIEDILYFEALGYKHTLRLYLINEILEFNNSLDHFQEQLGEGFWRCHRGFLVNRDHIKVVHMKEQIVELDTGAKCALSRKAKAEYRKKHLDSEHKEL